MIHFFMRIAGRKNECLKKTKAYRVSAIIATVLLLQLIYRIVLFLGFAGYAETMEMLANASLGIAVFVAADELFIKTNIRKMIYKTSMAVALYTSARLLAVAWIITKTL